MSDFISAGEKLVCPQCGELRIFERSVTDESLPFTIRCQCGYQLLFSKDEAKPRWPKIDPVNRVQGKWTVELQNEKDSKDRWKPVEGQPSFREQCNGIATHLAGGLQLIERLRSELRKLAEQVTQQFQSEWGMHSAFLRFWNPARVESWTKEPFCSFPVKCQDRLVAPRTRLFLHPSFFTPVVGFPLQAYGSFYAQLITPYLLIEFPLETWLRNLLEVMPTPELHVAGDRIVGRDLLFCWRDIPGAVPAEDHHDDAPILKIRESYDCRQWLARMSVAPWNIGPLTEEHAFKALWTYYESSKNFPAEMFKSFVKYGRLALFLADQNEAWEFAMSVGAFMFGQKLVLISSPERQDYLQATQRESHLTKANTGFHWKVVKHPEDLDHIPWDQISYVIVDYNEDFLPDALEKLYGYKGRLIMIGHDPLMDTLGENWEAASFYGLVSRTIWHPELAGIKAPFDYEKCQDGLISSILASWTKGSQIVTANAIPPSE